VALSPLPDIPQVEEYQTNPIIPQTNFRIFDIVLYHNEIFMLVLRLRTLYRWVDKHYIGFSLSSFSHQVQENLSLAPFELEIQSFSSRIAWIEVGCGKYGPMSPWACEETLRRDLFSAMVAEENPQPDDLVIWSDLDEIMYPSGMAWVRRNPPRNFYRFVGIFHFYTYRWRFPDVWRWAYIQRYGSKNPNVTWFKQRTPDSPAEEVPGISLAHCSYCFHKLEMVRTKLRSFSHTEFSENQYRDLNFLYGNILCGFSFWGGKNFSLTEKFDIHELDFPLEPKFQYLKRRVQFDDLHECNLSRTEVLKVATCTWPAMPRTAGYDLPVPNGVD
jgi:hypothetical protein